MTQERLASAAVRAYCLVILWCVTETWTGFAAGFAAAWSLTLLDVFVWGVIDEVFARQAVARATLEPDLPPVDPALAHLEPDIHARLRANDLARRIRQSRAGR